VQKKMVMVARNFIANFPDSQRLVFVGKIVDCAGPLKKLAKTPIETPVAGA
jgi:hypothetical protein